MKATLHRLFQNSDTTIGILICANDLNSTILNFRTLEPAYRENAKNISSIPSGKYECVLRFSQKHKFHYILKNVPNRELILIHVGNFVHQTQGCILIGTSFEFDIKNKNVILRESRKAMKEFLNLMGERFELTIKNEF